MLWNNSHTHYLRPVNRHGLEMNDLFNMFFLGDEKDTGKYPPVNIWAGEDSIILMAELPGCKVDEIDVSCVKNQVTISLERKTEAKNDGYERVSGDFKRTFEIPYEINDKKTEAIYKNGLLQIIMPKAESAKPKQITVKG